jgi:hypothetical protein
MKKTIVTLACYATVISLFAQSAPDAVSQESPIVLSAQRAIAGNLGIQDENEYYKYLVNLMRVEALPRELRLRLAYKVLEGNLPESGVVMLQGRLFGLSNAALLTLGRLEDVNAIGFLEQKLPLWEKMAEPGSSEDQLSGRLVPDVLQARITLARLRAVRAVPLRSANDVRERFRRMLQDLNIPVDEWDSLMREAENNPKLFDEALLEVGTERHQKLWRARMLLKEYAQMLLQARIQGHDVSKLLAEYPFEATDLARAYANLARLPNETRLQQVVQQAFQWRVMNTENAAYAQYLLDHSEQAVPIILNAVRSLDSSSLSEPGVGLAALTEVVATAIALGSAESNSLEALNQASTQHAQRFVQKVREQVLQRKVQVFMSSL